MAGITGALIFIALKPFGLSEGTIYMIAAPTAIPYFLCFYWLNKQKKQYQYVPSEEEKLKSSETVDEYEIATMTNMEPTSQNLEEEGVIDN